MKNNKISKELLLVIIPVGIGINIGIGEIVYLLKLPIFLDAIGTIIITLLVGWRSGALTGILSFVLLTVLGLNPYTIYFIITQFAIALFVYAISVNGFLRTLPFVILSGIFLGIISAVISAPVKVYLFGGVESTGSGIVIAYLLKTGESIMRSVFFAGLSIEPIDKTIQLLISVYIIKGAPKKILEKFSNPLMKKNFFK